MLLAMSMSRAEGDPRSLVRVLVGDGRTSCTVLILVPRSAAQQSIRRQAHLASDLAGGVDRWNQDIAEVYDAVYAAMFDEAVLRPSGRPPRRVGR